MSRANPPVRALDAEIDVEASAAGVWAVVSDVRRTGEWSPECFRVMPIGGVRRGARLIGLNRRGATRWPTLSRIVDYDPGRRIAWVTVTDGAEWAYRLEPTATGTRLVETRRTPEGVRAFARWFIRTFLGGEDRHDHELEDGMASGLARIKSIAERGARPGRRLTDEERSTGSPHRP